MMTPNYRVVLLADIHGNDPAFDAVLQDMEHWQPDQVILLGDLVMNCIYPVEVLDRIQSLSLPSVIGNTDEEVLRGTDPVAVWAGRQIGEAGMTFLQALPLRVRVTPPDAHSPANDLLIVHSTPRSSFDLLILEPHPLGTSFTETTPETEIAAMLQDSMFHTMVYGHIHYVSAARWHHGQLSSIGSVGFPFDGDPRAAYALADWDGSDWQITHHRVSYDYERVARAVERSDLPFAARYAAMLRAANWLPRSQFTLT